MKRYPALTSLVFIVGALACWAVAVAVALQADEGSDWALAAVWLGLGCYSCHLSDRWWERRATR